MTKQKQTRKELEENRTEWIIFIVICGMIIGSTFTMVLVALIGSDKFFSDAKDLQQENTQLREECKLTNITANKNVTLKGYETQTSDRYECNFTMQQGENYTLRDLQENCKEMGI